MIGRLFLISTLLVLAWSASLSRDESDAPLSRSKRHPELIALAEKAGRPPPPPGQGQPTPPPGFDDVNPAMIIDDNCDNGQENLTMDWDYNPAIYTCDRPNRIPPNSNPPLHYCQDVLGEPRHICTYEPVPPNPDPLPISGPHRPVFPQYGEYRYIPPQRYLHGLEHGAIALLYHPCADPTELAKLKDVINSCLWRHIISATDLLDDDHPFALLSWGCYLKLGRADIELAVSFTKRHALQSAEFAVFFDGFFNSTLIEHSKIVTDKKDEVICPTYPDIDAWLVDSL